VKPDVIELRTHGVSGTPPESMLNAFAAVQVDGDARGRFFAAADFLGVAQRRVQDLNYGSCKAIRFREGYHWGNMTSGGLRQALWAVLLPFAMVNLAQWMVPPATGTAGRLFVYVLRGLVRVVGLSLTVLLMVQLTVIVADTVAAQCIAGGRCELDVGIVRFFRNHTVWLAVAVAVVVIAPVVAAARITKLSDEGLAVGAYSLESGPPHDDDRVPRANIAEEDFYVQSTSSPARTLHAIAALAAPTLVLTGGLHPVGDGWQHWPWRVAVVLLIVTAVVTFVLDDPRGSGGRFNLGGRMLIRAFDRRWTLLWWGIGVANLCGAAVFSLRNRVERLPGVDGLVQGLVMTIAALCLIAAAMAAVVAVVSRRQYWKCAGEAATVPKPYQPWLFGTATAFLLPLAALLGAGLGAGATQTVRSCLTVGCKPKLLASSDPAGPTMPPIYDAIALLWGLIAIGVIALVVIGSGLFVRAAGMKNTVPERVQGMRATRSWFLARINQQTHRIIALLVAWAVVAAVFTWVAGPLTYRSILQGVGVFLLAFILLGLLWAIYNAYRRPDTAGRSLGVLWDLASFWPAEGHPIVPPCYARKAIDDLTRRAEHYLDEYPEAKLVLCGHSQGSLLMYATVLRLIKKRRESLDRVGLITYGSQLQWAYGRGFPDMLSYFSHDDVMNLLGGRWFNAVRFTDAVGGPVLSWHLTVDEGAICGRGLVRGAPRSTGAVLSVSDRTPGPIWVGNELWLPDPVLDKPVFPPRKHSDYTLDRLWDTVVARAAGLARETSR
jgi:hypothetical protein